MAIGKGRDSGSSNVKRLYTGAAKFKVIGVNPTKEELSEIYGGAEIKSDPVYTGKDKEGDTYARVDIFLKLAKEDNTAADAEIITKIPFFISNTDRVSQAGDKVEVINIFGKATWLTHEELESGQLSEKMSWYDMTGVRKAFRGESNLTEFIFNYLNISRKDKVDDVEEAYCRLEDFDSLFSGDASEIQEAFEGCNNSIVCLLGVNSREVDGEVKDYQTVYDRKFFRPWMKQDDIASKFRDELENANVPENLNYGQYPYILKEYKETAENAENVGWKAPEPESAPKSGSLL